MADLQRAEAAWAGAITGGVKTEATIRKAEVAEPAANLAERGV